MGLGGKGERDKYLKVASDQVLHCLLTEFHRKCSKNKTSTRNP